MVHEALPGGLIHGGIDLAIDLLHEEAFEQVEADEEVIDTNNAQDEGTKGGQTRDGLEGDPGNMRAFHIEECGTRVDGCDRLHDGRSDGRQ